MFIRLGSLIATLLLPVVVSPAAQGSEAPSVRWRHAHVVAGGEARAVVHLGDARGTVRLQRRTQDRWRTVRTVDHPAHRLRLRIPTDFYSRLTYRVRVGDRTVGKRRVVVRPEYEPRNGRRSFSVTESQGRVPRWDPCEPIRYQVNDAQAAPGALHDVRKALRRLSRATGLRFEYAGRTGLIPTAVLGLLGSVDLVISWARPGQTGLLQGGVAGQGGGSWISGSVDDSGRTTWRRSVGYVVLDARQNSSFAPGFRAGRPSRGMLLMHELGHVVGLEHTGDARQVMYPSITARSARYAAGDLHGLRLLGAENGCLTRS